MLKPALLLLAAVILMACNKDDAPTRKPPTLDDSTSRNYHSPNRPLNDAPRKAVVDPVADSIRWQVLREKWIMIVKNPSRDLSCDFLNHFLEYEALLNFESEHAYRVMMIVCGLSGALIPKEGQRDTCSVRAYFALAQHMDGECAQSFRDGMGYILLADPETYLKTLRDYRDEINSVYPSYDEKYETNPKLESEEILRRIAALASVRNPQLKDIRDDCIRRLKFHNSSIDTSQQN